MHRDFSLELAELTMVLSMKSLEDIDFETAVRSSAVSTGNDYLFSFPAERFPLKCSDAGCIRIKTEDNYTFCYVYRETKTGPFLLASANDIDAEYFGFAESFASILTDLKDTIGDMVTREELH